MYAIVIGKLLLNKGPWTSFLTKNRNFKTINRVMSFRISLETCEKRNMSIILTLFLMHSSMLLDQISTHTLNQTHTFLLLNSENAKCSL